ncbi:MAG: L,D-transpeptidase [Candidatus Levybacteria bacterium]|nr:L,D-transpeptidase [Candidatus Levybacteria bacterium]
MKKYLLPLILLLVIGAILLKSNSLKNTPNWGDGTDAFYKELIASKGDFAENADEAVFDNQVVRSITKEETENILAQAQNIQKQVLGLHTVYDGAEKWIEVDLSDLKLYAWEGKSKVYEFSVSTGRPGYETPTGEFRVWRKVLSQRYKGGIFGTSSYYNLPNVPYSLFFGGENVPNWKGFAIHGAYWHNDFGVKNRSSGCVNLKPEEVGLLYNWAGPTIPAGANALTATEDNPGTKVVIHD